MEALRIVADVEAAHREATVRRGPDDGEHIDDGDIAQEAVGGVVDGRANGVLGPAHDTFHAVDGSEVVAAVDAIGTARTYEDVLRIVGHADHFMQHDLADGEHEIMTAARDEAIGLRGPWLMQLALGNLFNELAGYFAEGFDIGAPVMDTEE
jgi:hypothetical protein